MDVARSGGFWIANCGFRKRIVVEMGPGLRGRRTVRDRRVSATRKSGGGQETRLDDLRREPMRVEVSVRAPGYCICRRSMRQLFVC